MRLSKEEIAFIKKTINSFIDGDIYIFGSQIEDNKKGGDLDIFIIPKIKKNYLEEIALIKTLIEEKLLLKTDIIISKNKNRDIEKEALKGIKI